MNWKNRTIAQKWLLVTGIGACAVYVILALLNHFDLVQGLDAAEFAAFGVIWLSMALLERNRTVKILRFILAGLGFFRCLAVLILG